MSDKPELIAMQDNLGLGHKGRIIITTQKRVDENLPWIAELPSTEEGAALSLITRCNEYDSLKAKADRYEKALQEITKHAYKGIVMTLAHKALEGESR